MKVLVIGGAGYIGSVVVRELQRRGHEPVVYDNLRTGHREAVPPEVPLVLGDLADRDQLATAFQRYAPEAVMHFAAFIEAGESMRFPGRFFANNVASVITLLNTMLDHDVTRFVFSSSAAVYGDPDSLPVTETAFLRSTNPYGETKAMVETVLRWLGELSGLRYVSLRYFNAAGAADGVGEDHSPETHLIPIVLQSALGLREAVTIYGDDYPTRDGTCIRDYVHVSDLAQAHALALDYLTAQERSLVCNLGSEQGASVREVVEAARRITGIDFPVLMGPRREGDPASIIASSQRAMEALGWRREHSSLEEIIASAWEWHRTHPRGYASS
ncbi:MAG: UDP-glucose 4-epimerase GalE [Chloroflexi bacterium]|nr:UDP-glucose 4-epimerase GalE [Chloroflexota bacterium]